MSDDDTFFDGLLDALGIEDNRSLEDLVKEAAEAAIRAEMHEEGFEGSLEDGFVGYTTLWKDADLPSEQVHISYPDGRVTPSYDGQPGDEITPAPDGLRLDAVAIFQKWPEFLDLAFYPWYSRPLPEDFDSRVASAYHAVEVLSTALPGVDGEEKDGGQGATIDPGGTGLRSAVNLVNSELGKYSGDAMDSLKVSYTSRLDSVLGGLGALTSVAAIGMRGQQEIWRAADKDIKQVAIHARRAFDAIRRGEGISAYDAVSAGGIAAGIVGLFATGPVGLAVGIASTAASVATTFMLDAPEPPAEIPFEADSTQGVYDKVVEGIADLRGAIQDDEDAFRNCMDEALRAVDEDPSTFDFGRPRDFLHSEKSEVFARGENIEVLMDQLAFVATRLEWIAQEISPALGLLDSLGGSDPWSRAGAIGIGPEGYYFAWDRLTAEASTNIASTRRALHDVAVRMVYVSNDFRGTEERNEAELRRLLRKAPDPEPVM